MRTTFIAEPQRSMLRLLTAILIAATAYSATTLAQERLPTIGLLTVSTEEAFRKFNPDLIPLLEKSGWIDGKNVSIIFAGAGGNTSRFSGAARKLVNAKVDVIYADGAPAVRAAVEATREIPIVGVDFTNDPVEAGYANSYGHPGKNVTGIFLDAPAFAGKWIQMMKSIVPNITSATVVYDPGTGDTHLRAIETVARRNGINLRKIQARTLEEIDGALSSKLSGNPQAIFFVPSPLIYIESERLARLTSELGIAATSMAPIFAEYGGLLAYGPQDAYARTRLNSMISKVLNGRPPAEIPIESPAKFDLVLNLRAAKRLGITVPEDILLRADRIIE